MGKIIISKERLTFTPLNKRFYFTGGTALSAIYLHHRESEDLDFFSQDEFESEIFVDLYFLLKEFTLWDLIDGVKHKFKIELDLIWLGSDFLKVSKFDYLPKMLIPLKLEDLQIFYKDLAKKIGLTVIEK